MDQSGLHTTYGLSSVCVCVCVCLLCEMLLAMGHLILTKAEAFGDTGIPQMYCKKMQNE